MSLVQVHVLFLSKRGKINYFLKLPKKSFGLQNSTFILKNESCQSLQTFLVELKCLAVKQLSCMLLDKYKRNKYCSHKLLILKLLLT